MAKPDVRDLVSQHEATAAQELGLTREKVLEGLRDALEMARAQNNPVAMVAALRESAKIMGLHAPERTQVQVGVEGERLKAQMATMPDAELIALAEAPDGAPLLS